MNQNRGVNTNQIHENVYCNSESYNGIYDKNLLIGKINQIKSFVENRFVIPNMQFYSKMLRINTDLINAASHQYTVDGEVDRRKLKLKVRTQHFSRADYILFSIEYKYIFDYYSNINTYAVGSLPVLINNNKCTCINRTTNNLYTFKAENLNVFHFTFHTPSDLTPKEKSKGSFHLKIDNLIHGGIIPYRPFIIDPRRSVVPKRFITWDMFDGSMNNFFAINAGVYGINDINSFLLRFPKQLSFFNTPTQNVHYINDIIKPLYDKIVVDILNPIPTIPTTITCLPPAIEYNRTIPMVKCCDMLLHGLNNNHRDANGNPQPGQRVLHGGRRKTKKNRRRESTSKNASRNCF